MNILVTGGAGYIGSHTCVALLEAGHSVIIADNLCNSKHETVEKIIDITNKEVTFYEIDVTDEQAVDVIPILPRFKFRPHDALDFNIWCYINYARDLGLPHCEYEDVYKFYDKKKKEYLEQYGDPYGIFEDEPTEKNRENVKKFITLPNDYNDDE